MTTKIRFYFGNLVYEIHYFNSLFGGHFVIISISTVQFSILLSPVVIGFQKQQAVLGILYRSLSIESGHHFQTE